MNKIKNLITAIITIAIVMLTIVISTKICNIQSYLISVKVITATFTLPPEIETTYKVQYYVENVESNDSSNPENYTLQEEITGNGIVNTDATAQVKTYTGFTYDENNINNVKTDKIKLNGKTVLKIYYTRNSYNLTLEKDDYIDTVTGAGNYKYEQPITISATLNQDLGSTFAFAKWQSSNTELVAEASTATANITMPAGDVTLKAKLNYGQKVNYSVTVNETTLNDWELFLKDDDGYAYMIYGDYLPNAAIPQAAITAGNLKKEGTYRVYANSNRIDAINAMKTESYWDSYITNELKILAENMEKTATAKGGVTVTEFIKSWNGQYTASQGQLIVEGDETNGWERANIGGTAGYEVAESENMYFPHKSLFDQTSGYLLASPSSVQSDKGLKDMNYTGYTGWAAYFNAEFAYRPIIRIPTSLLELNENGTSWDIKTLPKITYHVEHYKEFIDSDDTSNPENYTLQETEELTGYESTTVTAVSKYYKGFVYNEELSNETKSAPIASDGSTVLKLYYKRNSYSITFNANGGNFNSEGEEVNSINKVYKYGDSYEDIQTPTKEGYTFLYWKQIPEEYQELDYIKFSGSQYINTGIVPTNHETEIKFDFNENEKDIECVLGTPAGPQYYHFTAFKNQYYWGLNEGESHAGQFTSGIHTVIYNGEENSVTLDGTVIGKDNEILSNSQLYIGQRDLASFDLTGLVYNCKITDRTTGKIVRNLIPVYRKSDNVIGMYDTVNQVFYGNSGSGSFIKGNNVQYSNSENNYISGESNTLYAVWKKNLTVTFNANGGKIHEEENEIDTLEKTYYAGQTYGEMPNPTREEYAFLGWKQNNVPKEYQEVNYIRFDGNQYINTGIVPTNHETEIKFDFNQNEKAIECLLGTPAGPQYYHFTAYQNQYYWGLNAGESHAGQFTSGIHTLIYNGENNSVVLDGTVIGKDNEILSNSQLYIGQRDVASFDLTGLVYYCKITDKSTGNIVRELIPVYRKSDNVIGMYDTINGVFYENSGTGSFTKGADINYLTSESNLISEENHTLYAIWYKYDTPYKVEHYTENLDGTYTLMETENKLGVTGFTATAVAKQYEGFTFDENNENNIISDSVEQDESTVLKLYYTRNTYELILTKDECIDEVTGAGTYKYQEPVTISATLSSEVGSAITFAKWQSSNTSLVPEATTSTMNITMPAENITLKAKINYGQKVNYSVTVNGVNLNDWELFLKDDDGYAYMIYGDYLPNTAIPSAARTAGHISTGGQYRVWSTTNSTDLINAMKTESYWSSYITSDLAAVSTAAEGTATATGGATVTQFKESWNNQYTIEDKQITIAGDESNGWTGQSVSGSTGYNVAEANNMYFPHKSEVSDGQYTANGYWLASKCSTDNSRVMLISYNSALWNYTYNGGWALRPLIRIPASILELNQDGISWDIKALP